MIDKTTLDILWILLCAFLVFIMQAGFTGLEAGLTRSKNSINLAIKNLVDMGIAILLFWAFGYALMFGASLNGWFGITDFLWPATGGAAVVAFFLFQIMFCGTASTILSGAIAERSTFIGYIILTILLTGLIYPVFGHWAWNGVLYDQATGWLGALGFVDFAGSSVVHSLGGWVGLATLLVMGPRMGRFVPGKPPQKIQGNNLPLAVIGAFLLWIGWLGFNGGSALGLTERVPLIILNTILAAAGGSIISLFVEWRLSKLPQVEALINGALAGLVSITASAFAVSPAAALVIGGIGSLVMVVVDRLLLRWQIDDAVGAVPVHLGGGVWGTLAVALFADSALLGTGLSWAGQFGVQLLGIVVCGVWAFGASYFIIRFIDKIKPLRVTPEAEYRGLNISEHGATTELLDLLTAMQHQATMGDMSLRATVEPFTEVGQIAEQYNRVLDALQGAIGRTEAVLRSVHDGIITFTREGVLTSLNPAAGRLFGYAANELIGQPVTVLFEGAGGAGSLAWFGSGGLERSFDGRHDLAGRRKDQTAFPLELTVSRETIEDDVLYTGVLRDATERRRVEEARQALLDRRERQVQLATAVAQSIATATNLEELYRRIVIEVKETFGFYHTHLYRYDPTTETMSLIFGYGEAGRQMVAKGHRLPLGSGLVGTAASSRQSVLRPDVTADAKWLPNPLLPATRGEIAVPILLGDQVLGVLDVQVDAPDKLNAEDQLLLEGLCGQIAVAIETTRLREETEDQLRQLEAFSRLQSRERWAAYRTKHQETVGYKFEQNQLQPLERGAIPAVDQLQLSGAAKLIKVDDPDRAAIVAPLAGQGDELIGVLGVYDDPQRPLSPEEHALLEAVSEQISLALEAARLSEQVQDSVSETQQRAERERIIREITEKMRSAVNLEQLVRITTQEVGQRLSAAHTVLDLGIDEVRNQSAPR